MRIVPRQIVAVVGATVATALCAAPLKINGAGFDAPDTCQVASDALVCNVDGQQLEISVHRQPFAAGTGLADSVVKRGAALQELHRDVVAGLMRGTSSPSNTSFDTYGKLSVLGTLMPGRGEVAAPSARVTTLYSNGELWQILEVIARRTPAVEALTEALAKSLVLPPATPVVAATAPTSNPPKSTPPLATASTIAPSAVTPPLAPSTNQPEPPLEPVQTFQHPILSFQYPSELAVTKEAGGTNSVTLTLKHPTRPGRPGLRISLSELKGAEDTADAFITARKADLTKRMRSPATVAVNKLGDLSGAGYASIGTTPAQPSGGGIELFECTFAAVIKGKLLTVTLTSEQKFSEDAQYLWGMLGKSLVVR